LRPALQPERAKKKNPTLMLIEFAETLKVKVGEMFTKLVQCAALNWKLFGTNPSFRLLHCERAMAWATFGGTF
jgi:hypothetical protein